VCLRYQIPPFGKILSRCNPLPTFKTCLTETQLTCVFSFPSGSVINFPHQHSIHITCLACPSYMPSPSYPPTFHYSNNCINHKVHICTISQLFYLFLHLCPHIFFLAQRKIFAIHLKMSPDIPLRNRPFLSSWLHDSNDVNDDDHDANKDRQM
jgi:hypothetical protein